MRKFFAALTLAALSLAAIAGDSYQIDTGHSGLLFSVDHNNVGVSYGRFNKFKGAMEYDGDQLKSVDVTIDIDSVDSNHEKRDNHLRSDDFFSSKQFPEATFKSTKIESKGDVYHVTGDLTLAGKTNSVTLELAAKGPVDGRGGAVIRGLHGKGTFKRSDFGISYGMGGIGDEVTVIVALEVVHK